MDLDKFLSENDIEETEIENVDDASADGSIKIDASVLGHTKDRVRFELNGTNYSVAKSDVQDCEYCAGGLVTRTGKGKPATLTLKDGAKVVQARSIPAKDLNSELPFALSQPTQVPPFSFPFPVDPKEETWMRDRGLWRDWDHNSLESRSSSYCPSMSSSSSQNYTEQTSPGTSQPRLDNWYSDSHVNDGAHPDDNNSDDTHGDDIHGDDWA